MISTDEAQRIAEQHTGTTHIRVLSFEGCYIGVPTTGPGADEAGFPTRVGGASIIIDAEDGTVSRGGSQPPSVLAAQFQRRKRQSPPADR